MRADEELDKLRKMRDDGTITDEQYQRARDKILYAGDNSAPADLPVADLDESEPVGRRAEKDRRGSDYVDYRAPSPSEREKKLREWCMFLHLSMLAGHIVAFGGIIAPIVIWQIKKEEFPEIDEHGKNAVNWMISALIYVLISIPLCFIFVGFFFLILIAGLGIAFPIIAAIKANEGVMWKYPLTIRFLK